MELHCDINTYVLKEIRIGSKFRRETAVEKRILFVFNEHFLEMKKCHWGTATLLTKFKVNKANKFLFYFIFINITCTFKFKFKFDFNLGETL